MPIVDCIQGSAEWLDIRRGRLTASRMADILDRLKSGGEGASRRNYRIEQVAERLSGRTEDHFVSREMMWGTELEPMARSSYEVENDVMAQTVGFIIHPRLDFSGASPDSLIGSDGGLEIKCPKTTTHIRWVIEGVVPEEHQPQMLWNMACAERQWWDFVSYDPRLPAGLRMFTVRMHRDEERIAQIEREVIRFDAEVEAVIADLRKRVKPEPPPPPRETAPESMSAWAEQFESEYGETGI